MEPMCWTEQKPFDNKTSQMTNLIHVRLDSKSSAGKRERERKKEVGELPNRVTRLGNFWKVFPINFLTKAAQRVGNVLGHLEKCHFWNKNCWQLFLEKKMGYVLS